MINFPVFIEGLLMPLLGLGVFVVLRDQRERKESFMYLPHINYLIN